VSVGQIADARRRESVPLPVARAVSAVGVRASPKQVLQVTTVQLSVKAWSNTLSNAAASSNCTQWPALGMMRSHLNAGALLSAPAIRSVRPDRAHPVRPRCRRAGTARQAGYAG
jgi:hypothetical protein